MPVQTSYPADMQPGFLGMLADCCPREVESVVNSEASASIPFGFLVKKGTGDGTAINLASPDTAAVPSGIILAAHNYAKGDHLPGLDAVGLTPKTTMNLMRYGRIWVIAGTGGVTRDQRLYYRTLTAAGNQRWVASAIGADTLDTTGQAIARTSAAAGGLFILEVDFRNK